jgi:hypothetical protein
MGLIRVTGSSDRPVSFVRGESAVEQASQVQSGDPELEPGVVPVDTAVPDTAVAAGQPGDGPFDHGPVGAVIVLKIRVLGALAVLPLQRVMFVKFEFPALW